MEGAVAVFRLPRINDGDGNGSGHVDSFLVAEKHIYDDGTIYSTAISRVFGPSPTKKIPAFFNLSF